MADIVLKIYSTSNPGVSSWADTVDHTLSGDIIDYRIENNSNYNIDTAWFKINDSSHKWSDQITPDHYTGAAENTQVWRAFSRNNKLIGSGVITHVYKDGGYIIIQGEGMTSLLQRKVVQDEFFQTKDGSGMAVSGDFILMDATYGLIHKYLSTTYGAIGSTYVTTPTATEPRVWKFDGVTLWDACVDVARGSYGSNSKSYDVYLYETYTAPATFTMELYFKEIESTASAKTIRLSDVHVPSFQLTEHARENYNRVVVRGARIPDFGVPNDFDAFTSDYHIGPYVHDGGDGETGFFEDTGETMETDGGVVGMYVTNFEEGCAGKITTLTETKATCSGGFVGGATQVFNNEDTGYIGYWYITTEDAKGGGAGWSIVEDTSAPYASGTSMLLSRPVVTNRTIFALDIEQLGYTIDQRFTRLKMKIIGAASGGAGRKTFRIVLGVKDKYGNYNSDGNPANIDNYFYLLRYQYSIYCGVGYPASNMYEIDIPLPKPNLDMGWSDQIQAFNNSGIEQREWSQIAQVGVYLDDVDGEEITGMYISELRFEGPDSYTGVYPTEDPTIAREYPYTDSGLKSDTDCQNLAENVMTGLNIKQYQGVARLMGVKRDYTLKGGNTVEVAVPSKSINIRSGQTPNKLGIPRIILTPDTQELQLGRIYTTDEIINRVSRSLRVTNKID